MRLYHVAVIITDNKKKNFGKTIFFTATPVPHKQACTILSKITNYDWGRKTLIDA